jgi:hypothetical protein
MMQFEPRAYGPSVAALLENAKCNELGLGVPDATRRAQLAALAPETIAAPHAVRDSEMALACAAGLWLRCDFLDESHRISQNIDNPWGSFWHAIMHRREGDFDNAKYWFRRVGEHAIYAPLASAAKQLASGCELPPPADFLLHGNDWDAKRFVDLCRRALDDEPSLVPWCMNIQQREWELLFDDCYRQAIGHRS